MQAGAELAQMRVMFYSPVKDIGLFEVVGFYRSDIQSLRDLGCDVWLSNRVYDAFNIRDYDAVFIYFWTWGALVGLIARLLGKRVVFTGGADDLDRSFNRSSRKYLIRAFLFWVCYQVSHSCLIVSQKDLSNMRYLLGRSDKKLVYSPHQIDLTVYGTTAEPKKNMIVTIAWMGTVANVKRKGVDKLLCVLQRYLQLNPESEVYIIGTPGEGTTYLEDVAEQLGIKQKICLTGAISEDRKVELLKSSMFYWQVSEYEGFGLAALEALAAKNVVIHSGRGGLADAVGKYGLQVEPDDDPSRVARAVHELCQSPEARAEILKGVDEHLKQFSFAKREQAIAYALG